MPVETCQRCEKAGGPDTGRWLFIGVFNLRLCISCAQAALGWWMAGFDRAQVLAFAPERGETPSGPRRDG